MATSEDSGGIPAAPAAGPSTPAAPGAVNPSALTVEQLARLLTASGARTATEETIRRHVDAGAPTAADGRVNLVHYMAWLVREVTSADGEN